MTTAKTPAAPAGPPAGGPWRVPGYVQEGEAGVDAAGNAVVRARHEGNGTAVAITYVSAAVADEQGFGEAFKRAADVLGPLESPYVARLYAYVEDGQNAAIVREAVDGVALDALLTEGGIPAGPEASLVVLKDSLLGLAAAQGAGLDRKGYQRSNVLVTARGEVKLADLGVAEPVAEATDVQAATATFAACAVSQADVQPLLDRGLAAAEPPLSAADFAAEVEAFAVAAHGEDWAARGRHELGCLVAALLTPPPAPPVVAVPMEQPPSEQPPVGKQRFGRRAKILAIALAAVIVAGAVTVAAVATGNSDDAAATAATASPTATVPSATAAAPAPAPTTTAPSATSTPAATATPPPSPSASHAPAKARPKPTATPARSASPTPTKAPPAAGPHVSRIVTTLTCSPRGRTATAVVRVEYDGTAAGTLRLTWWRSATGSPRGATTMAPQTAEFPKGSTSYVYTANFAYHDNPDRPYIGVTVSTDPAAATGTAVDTTRCR